VNNNHNLDEPSGSGATTLEAAIPGPAAPVVLPEAEQASQPLPPQSKQSSSKPEVTVAPNLTDLVAGRIETFEDEKAARQGRNLNWVVHGVLIVGLGLSTILMVLGLALDFVRHQELPTMAPDLREVFHRTAEFRPSGFLTLGLLVLVATPILRVLGSFIAFLYEHDWRYAAVTAVVLVVVGLSLLFGRG
jgi:uncharacterized membrane protein